MKTIVVVDYGMGNLRSVAQALRHVAPEARRAHFRRRRRTSAPPTASCCRGRARCRDCMREPARVRACRKRCSTRRRSKPLLGVCVGDADAVRPQRGGRHAGPRALLPGKVVRFRLDGQLQDDGSALQGAADGLEPGAPGACRIRCGTASPTTAISTSCTATMPCPADPRHSAGETEYGAPLYLRGRAG